jgi:type II secretory pathway pseudopilin PulG
VAIIAIIASIAIPNMIAARLSANESAAIATMRNLLSCESQCQSSACIDTDGDGAGEFGFLAEVAGRAPLRNNQVGGVGALALQPPLLSTAFGNVQNSVVVRSGYLFQIFLPDSAGAGVAEAATGGASGVSIDANNAEVEWCAYAWPSNSGITGRRVFFTNQRGDLLSSTNRVANYNGLTTTPLPSAAFRAGTLGTLDVPPAANTVGLDGERWRVVN